MTREQAKKLDANPIWREFMAGKQVEYLSVDEWVPTDMLSTTVLINRPERYRIKPEPSKPRRFWINNYGEHDRALHDSKEHADEHASSTRRECIEVVEVLPQPASPPPTEQPQPAPVTIRRYAVLDEHGTFLATCPTLQDAWSRATDTQRIVELTGTYTP